MAHRRSRLLMPLIAAGLLSGAAAIAAVPLATGEARPSSERTLARATAVGRPAPVPPATALSPAPAADARLTDAPTRPSDVAAGLTDAATRSAPRGGRPATVTAQSSTLNTPGANRARRRASATARRAAAVPARPDTCVTCHAGIEDAHPKKPLTCTECHRGDAGATDPARAHAGMWRNPSDLRVVDRTCGTCHDAITRKVKASIMAHRSGTQSGTLFPNGLQPTREAVRFAMTPEPVVPGITLLEGQPLPPGALPRLDPLPTFRDGGDVFIDLLRKECTSCHLWTQPRAFRGNFRATGCAACHMPYAEDGRSAGGDRAMPPDRVGRPIRHTLTTRIPVTQCATCHNGGSRAAMNFRGLMEAPPEGRETFTYDQDLLHGHAYTRQPADVHFERGLGCIDCHTEREMHGDGLIYAKRHYEVEVRCESCHGTPDRIATGMTAQGRRLRNVFVALGAPPQAPPGTPALTSSAPPATGIISARQRGSGAPARGIDGDASTIRELSPAGLVTLVSKLTGKVHVVPQLATLAVQPPGHDARHVRKVECFTCHTAWAPTCYGCHIKMDFTAYRHPVHVAFDHLANEHATQGWFRLTPGVRFADPEPVLGVSWRGKVVPFVPRAQPLFSLVNPSGVLEYAFKKLGFAHNPIVPHTVVRSSRSCESCHGNPRALGLGLFTSREHPKLEEFGQPRDYRWDRIVDEDGHAVQVTTVDGARPLNREEMDRLRSAPYKLPPARR